MWIHIVVVDLIVNKSQFCVKSLTADIYFAFAPDLICSQTEIAACPERTLADNDFFILMLVPSKDISKFLNRE